MNGIEKKWWKEAVVYQIYPRSFMDSNGDGVGDLNGITGKLDYLALLGINVIWLSPVYDSPNDDNGYDIRDYRAIMKEFGTMSDFDRLLAEAHKRNIKIVMDLVVNHSSDEHQWFLESKKSKDNLYRDYYIWREGSGNNHPNNWGSWFSGSAWEYDPGTDSYYLHIFSRKQPDLNWDNETVRNEVYDMMRFWLDKGIDGFRMDVISLISKTPGFPDGEVSGGPGAYGDLTPFCENGPRVHEYLKEMNQKVLSRYDIMTVGETPNATVEDAQKYTNAGGSELNMVFQFEHMGLDHGKFGKWTNQRFKLSDLKQAMTKWQEGLYGKGWNSLYWENHDRPRSVSRFGNDSTPLLREKSAKMLALCLHMMQGTPYIYQGQELGMTNARFDALSDYRDIETLNAYKYLVENTQSLTHDEMMAGIWAQGRDNARFPFQWDGSRNAGFSAGTPWIKPNPNYTEINAASQTGDPDSVFSWYRRLIRLRGEHDIIVYGEYCLVDDKSEEIYAYTRALDDESLLVICSFSEKKELFDIPASLAGKNRKLLIGNYGEQDDDGDARLVLKPYECRAYLV
jgi:oligo-1,6-glucosidase